MTEEAESEERDTQKLEWLRLQIRLKRLEVAQARLKQAEEKTKEGPGSGGAQYLTSPMGLALITGLFGLLVTLAGNLVQGALNLRLERQKDENAVLIKGLDTHDPAEAAKYIRFLVQYKLVSDPTGKLASVRDDEVPLLPTSSHSADDASRLTKLHPEVAGMARALIIQAKAANIDVMVTSGYRSPEEQALLYAQGRTTSGPTVTNDRPYESTHNCGLAFDVAIIDALGSPVLDRNDPSWKRLVPLATSVGLVWGGKDNDNHFELKGADCKAGRQLTNGG